MSTLALYKMRRDHIGAHVVAAAIPALLFFTAADFLVALGVKGHASLGFSFSVTFTMASAMAVTSGLILAVRRVEWPAEVRTFRSLMIVSLINGSLYIGMSSSKAVAVCIIGLGLLSLQIPE